MTGSEWVRNETSCFQNPNVCKNILSLASMIYTVCQIPITLCIYYLHILKSINYLAFKC